MMKVTVFQRGKKTTRDVFIMASQPTPPNVPPPEIRV